ncbi:30S ribosomal protein S1 [Halochromatium roseum]|uniref:30S ribosomal protein S1 n=1 Tax=Halochromatium roseum TaxID=391920 RepID=UPI001913AA1A|nr:S1 RNA-binding domain-containing protein [Halochromatium roseum]MBK5937760.1 30S ribosomal protein S1 [Halochromatium roseum]
MTDDNDFEALLKELEKTEQAVAARPKVGDRVKGTIIEIGEEHVFVDIGGKAEATMEVANLRNADGLINKAVGDSIEAAVTGVDPDSGTLVLGSRHGRHAHGADQLEAAFQAGTPVEGQITGTTKGGLEVQIAGQRAFCPASQADIRFIEDLSTLVGERASFRITKFEGGRRMNLVVSRRAVLAEEQAERAAELRAKLEPGAVLPGVVVGLQEFGAFVDLGGVEGMIHISELALGRVRHPEEVLSIGQELEVAVLRVEQTNNPKRPERIALSIRALAKNPWSDAAQRYHPGTRVRGRIERLEPFGAFVEIEPGLTGLVHVSELGAGRRVEHPKDIVQVGQEVDAVIVQVDTERRRIGLSLAADRVVEAEASSAQPTSPTDSKNDRRATESPEEPGLGTLGELLKAQLGQDDAR